MCFKRALKANPEYVKPRYQLAERYKEEEKYQDALVELKKILELTPDDFLVQKQVRECERLDKEKMEKMKDQVVGQLKDLGNMFLGKFGLSTDNFKFDQNADGTYGMNFQQ